jgi:hypothetical protein
MKQKKTGKVSASTVSTTPPQAISHDQIATLAAALWRQEGSPSGRDEEIWLEAERQLRRGQAAKALRLNTPGPSERMDELEAIYPDPSSNDVSTSL